MSHEQIRYQDASTELQSLYDEISIEFKLTGPPNWATYLGNKPSVLRGVWQLYTGIVIDGTLPPLLQELIIFSVSKEQGSAYCAEFHASSIQKLSPQLSYLDLVDIIDGKSRGVVPERYIMAINIAIQLNRSPCPVPSKDAVFIKSDKFSLKEHVEIAGLVALAITFNMHAKTISIPIDSTHRVEGFYL